MLTVMRSDQSPNSMPDRVAIYARFSSEMQRRTSVEDQTRQCRECASEKGWIVLPDYIRSDEELSGATLATRPGLVALMEEAQKTPRPIDGIVIDDTSRLGRNLGDVLQICSLMKFYEIFLYFVNQELDSRDPNFYQLIINYGAGDEQFLTKLAHAVRRGQRGRILAGMISGGIHYGYKHVEIEDPTKPRVRGRPAIKGVRLEIVEVEAAAIRLIFDSVDEGLSFLKIAQRCIAQNLPRPVLLRNHTSATWTPSTIHSILHNELYCGRLIWGRTKTAKNPTNGRIVAKPQPKEKWTSIYLPELRIISDEQWERVHAIIASHKNVGLSRIGGMARTTSPEKNLFSGHLFCGVCSGPMVITYSAKGGDRVYQCRTHRLRPGECSNKLPIRRSVLEDQLITAIVQKTLQSETLERVIAESHQQLTGDRAHQLEVNEKRQALIPQLAEEKRQLKIETQNIVVSLCQYGPSDNLFSELKRLETRMKAVEEQLNLPVLGLQEISLDEVREYVINHAKNLTEILLGDRTAAQQRIRRYIGPLTLTPKTEDGFPVYHVTGGIQLPPEPNSRMPSESLPQDRSVLQN